MTNDLLRQADQCRVLSRAVALAGWVGEGRQVTPKGVLRPADVRAAATALGITVPAHIRTAADVVAIHRPWVVAEALGMLIVDGSRVSAAPVRGGDDRLEAWLTGLDAVLRAESRDDRRQGATMLCRTLLTVLATDPPPRAGEFEETLYDYLRHHDDERVVDVFHAFSSTEMPVDAGLGLLADFGAVDGGRLTELGHWRTDSFRPVSPGR